MRRADEPSALPGLVIFRPAPIIPLPPFRTQEPAMKIAVMPGDGVGKEVIPQGLRVLQVAARKFGFTYDTTDYPFGAEHYLEAGVTLPDSALKEIAAHDAILFGAVGADPRGNARIPQGLIETDI